jgi:hypothetical protein
VSHLVTSDEGTLQGGLITWVLVTAENSSFPPLRLPFAQACPRWGPSGHDSCMHRKKGHVGCAARAGAAATAGSLRRRAGKGAKGAMWTEVVGGGCRWSGRQLEAAR